MEGENAMNFGKHIVIQQARAIGKTHAFMVNVAAKVTDMTDKMIVDACIEAAKEAGITDLYLIDKTFLLEAIRGKLDHNTVSVADLMKKQKMIYDEFERAHMVVEVSDIVDLIERKENKT